MADFANWLKEFIHNIIQAVIDFFVWLIDLVKDIFIWLIDSILSAIITLISLIPVPDFVKGGLGAITSGFPPLLTYVLTHTGFVEGLAIIGAAYLFRLLRKFATLFQW